MAKHGRPLGIDIGGSGIKGAPVDLKAGDLAGKRFKILTPKPATPDAVAEVVDQIVDHFDDVTGDSPIGVTVPAVVIRGMVLSAANIDPSWIDIDAEALIKEHTGRAVTRAQRRRRGRRRRAVLRRGQGREGPGHPHHPRHRHRHRHHPRRPRSSPTPSWVTSRSTATTPRTGRRRRPRTPRACRGTTYVERLQPYYDTIEKLFSPDLIVVGGGISKDSDEFLPMLKLRCPIVPAQLRNQAGIIGAAHLAVDLA